MFSKEQFIWNLGAVLAEATRQVQMYIKGDGNGPVWLNSDETTEVRHKLTMKDPAYQAENYGDSVCLQENFLS